MSSTLDIDKTSTIEVCESGLHLFWNLLIVVNTNLLKQFCLRLGVKYEFDVTFDSGNSLLELVSYRHRRVRYSTNGFFELHIFTCLLDVAQLIQLGQFVSENILIDWFIDQEHYLEVNSEKIK